MSVMFMRAQLSFEYLIIALIGLILISISIFALNKIRSNADNSYENVKFKAMKEDFFNMVDEICALGNGNSKAINLAQQITIQSDSRNNIFFLTISNNRNSAAHETSCEIDINGQFDSEITIANDNGKIINK
ncbi:hypothetical protein J4450_02590 [Candidatus Micrarchaeota archaeon]|nr:hypothetical protein [Candidatus Micrarchaeota archaeon]